MDEIYVTYVDDEHVDNHDYDDNTDDDHDNIWPAAGRSGVCEKKIKCISCALTHSTEFTRSKSWEIPEVWNPPT